MLLGDFIKTYRHPSDNQYHSPVINGIVDFAQSKVSWFYNVFTYMYMCVWSCYCGTITTQELSLPRVLFTLDDVRGILFLLFVWTI